MLDFDLWRRRIREETFSLYHYEMGRAIEREGDGLAAVEAYRRAIAAKPDLTVAHYRLADLLESLSRPDEAEILRREALARDPSYPARAWLHIAGEHFNKGEMEHVFALTRQIAALEALNSNPGLQSEVNLINIDAHCRLGRQIANEGDEARALESYRAGLKIIYGVQADDISEEMATQWAEIEFTIGSYLFRNGCPAETTGFFRRAVQITPTKAACYDALGLFYMKCDAFSAAVPMLMRAVRLDPASAAPVMRLGWCLLNCQQTVEAEAWSREALRLNPQAPLAHCCLAMTLQLQGRREEALAAHHKSVALGWPSGHIALFLAAEGQPEEALRLLQDAAAPGSNRAWRLSCRGAVLYALGRVEEALADHREAVSLEPNQAWHLVNYALDLDALGHREQALEHCRSAWAQQPASLALQIRLRPWAAAKIGELLAAIGVTLS